VSYVSGQCLTRGSDKGAHQRGRHCQRDHDVDSINTFPCGADRLHYCLQERTNRTQRVMTKPEQPQKPQKQQKQQKQQKPWERVPKIANGYVVRKPPTIKQRLIVLERVVRTMIDFCDEHMLVEYRDDLEKLCFTDEFVKDTGVTFFKNLPADIAAQMDCFVQDGRVCYE